jgi:hypothetical protein
MSTQTDSAPVDSSGRRPPSRRSKALVALAVGVAVVPVGWLLWTWRHPEVFRVIDAGFVMSAQNPKATRPMYYGMTSESPASTGEVVISHIEALDVADDHAARIRFYVCTIDPTSGAGSIGSVSGPALRDEYATVVPARGASLEINADPRQQVAMSVELRQPRALTIRGMSLTYKHGWQTGTQTTGPSVEYRP